MAMTQAQRNANAERVIKELGVDRMGLGPDAPKLPPRAGRGDVRGSQLPIENNIAGVLLFEFGEIWGRPGLDLKTRSFISVAALIGMRAEDLLYRHINIALNLGVTPEEIHEVLLHGSVYGGYAAWYAGAAVANEVFVARGLLEAGSGVTPAPAPPMTHEERLAARERIINTLAVSRLGLAPDAPTMTPLPGGPTFTARMDPLEQELAFIGADQGYGEVWGRPGLSLRIRSFVTMALLQVMLESSQLHIHIANALNLGVARDEINEALMQAGVYHGTSGWHHSITVARHVFEQHPAAGGKTKA